MKRLIGRRHFMKSTLAGFGGFFFLGSNDKKQEEKVIDIKGREKKFVYRIENSSPFPSPHRERDACACLPVGRG